MWGFLLGKQWERRLQRERPSSMLLGRHHSGELPDHIYFHTASLGKQAGRSSSGSWAVALVMVNGLSAWSYRNSVAYPKGAGESVHGNLTHQEPELAKLLIVKQKTNSSNCSQHLNIQVILLPLTCQGAMTFIIECLPGSQNQRERN